MKIMMMSILMYMASVMNVMASSGVRDDDGMFLVYCFLGICASIIFLQVIPLLILGYGIVRGLFGKKVKV